MAKIRYNYKSELTMKTKNLLLGGMLLLGSPAGWAQGVQVSYEHDDAKMNQVTVMESGTGTLSPAWYYNTLHENYGKSAASKNKTLFRTTAGINLYNQKDKAEQIDSALVKRAAVEALNVADRSGGALDLAWKAEGPKLSEKMSGRCRRALLPLHLSGHHGRRRALAGAARMDAQRRKRQCRYDDVP